MWFIAKLLILISLHLLFAYFELLVFSRLDGRWRMDTYICMVDNLCCPPETITTLLLGFKMIFFKNVFIKNTMYYEDMRYFRGWLNFVLNNIELPEAPKKGKENL